MEGTQGLESDMLALSSCHLQPRVSPPKISVSLSVNEDKDPYLPNWYEEYKCKISISMEYGGNY